MLLLVLNLNIIDELLDISMTVAWIVRMPKLLEIKDHELAVF